MSSAHVFYVPIILFVGIFAGYFIGRQMAEREAYERRKRARRKKAMKERKKKDTSDEEEE